MTSSLVGSEMCIRDREAAAAPWCYGMVTKEAKQAKARARTREKERAKAVSYTHLTLPTICSV
eukprot:3383096-Prorocentrum_lima.AAC.1